MHHRRLIFVDFDAGLDQLRPMILGGGADNLLIGEFTGQDDFHGDAAPGGIGQFLAGEGIGQKIRILDAQRFLCRGNGEEIHQIQIGVALRAPERLRERGSRGGQRRKVIGAVQQVAAGFQLAMKMAWNWATTGPVTS